jgi:uncharacterized membrane protein YhhN
MPGNIMARLAENRPQAICWARELPRRPRCLDRRQRQRQRQGGGRLRARPALAAPYIAAFGALNAYLWKRTGKDRIPVIVYSTALLAMSLVALDCGSSQAAAGGALFLVSDTLLALEKFGDVHVPANESLVMATYTSAQALLAR